MIESERVSVPTRRTKISFYCLPTGKLAEYETENFRASSFKLQVSTLCFYWNLSPKAVIHRMPEHGAGTPTRDELAWISSLRSSLTCEPE
jgi:hypothetical protein